MNVLVKLFLWTSVILVAIGAWASFLIQDEWINLPTEPKLKRVPRNRTPAPISKTKVDTDLRSPIPIPRPKTNLTPQVIARLQNTREMFCDNFVGNHPDQFSAHAMPEDFCLYPQYVQGETCENFGGYSSEEKCNANQDPYGCQRVKFGNTGKELDCWEGLGPPLDPALSPAYSLWRKFGHWEALTFKREFGAKPLSYKPTRHLLPPASGRERVSYKAAVFIDGNACEEFGAFSNQQDCEVRMESECRGGTFGNDGELKKCWFAKGRTRFLPGSPAYLLWQKLGWLPTRIPAQAREFFTAPASKQEMREPQPIPSGLKFRVHCSENAQACLYTVTQSAKLSEVQLISVKAIYSDRGPELEVNVVPSKNVNAFKARLNAGSTRHWE